MRYLKRLFSVRARDFLHMDYLLLMTVMGITAFGIYNINKATYFSSGMHYVKMQLIFTAIGLLVAFAILCMDYKRTMPLIDIFYWATVALLIGVLFVPQRNGITGWFSLGPIALQPAELAKLAVVLMVSKKLQTYNGNINNFKVFLIVAFYSLLPMGLMMLQPEMGLTMVTFFAVFFICFINGIRLRVIFGGIAIGIGSLFALIKFNILTGLWRQRILMFFSSSNNELDEAFQLSTGLTAIGSGSVTGSVTPGYYAIIPEVHTDMIFAVIAENFGYIGSVLLVAAYCIILLRLIRTGKSSKDIFGKSVCAGLFGVFFFSILQNIGMTLKLMPISGITLPFASYGGSSMITNIIAIAIALNIGMRRKKPQIGY